MAELSVAAGQLSRPLDVVVWGATGFTGKLVCRHLAQNYKGVVNWGMAGRDIGKLEATRSTLKEVDPNIEQVPILTADLNDQNSIDEMVNQGKVLITTAGPYKQLGTPIVDACVRNSTHYCDLTAEIPWMKQMINKYDTIAKENNAKIVFSCGYDSIPSDLGTYFVVQHANQHYNRRVKEVQVLQGSNTYGGFSGGTLASLTNMLQGVDISEISDYLTNGYYLVPQNQRGNQRSQALSDLFLKYLPESETWAGIGPMAPVNAPTVYKSAALSKVGYSEDFKYVEGVEMSGLIPGVKAPPIEFLAGCLYVGALGSVVGSLLIPGVYPVLQNSILPKQGEGPSWETMTKLGKWEVRVVAVLEGDQQPKTIQARVGDYNRDPGYWGTSRMILESALCMALQEGELASQGYPSGGFLTPSLAMGDLLIKRLQNADIFFNLVS